MQWNFLFLIWISGFVVSPDKTSATSEICGLKYFLSNDKLNWYSASKICKRNGMQLVTILSEEKFQEVYNVVKDMDGPVWTGGYKENDTHNWRWAGSGIPISIKSNLWAPNEPRLKSYSIACLQLWESYYFKFDDYYCVKETYYMCESIVEHKPPKDKIVQCEPPPKFKIVEYDPPKDQTVELDPPIHRTTTPIAKIIQIEDSSISGASYHTNVFTFLMFSALDLILQ